MNIVEPVSCHVSWVALYLLGLYLFPILLGSSDMSHLRCKSTANSASSTSGETLMKNVAQPILGKIEAKGFQCPITNPSVSLEPANHFALKPTTETQRLHLPLIWLKTTDSFLKGIMQRTCPNRHICTHECQQLAKLKG